MRTARLVFSQTVSACQEEALHDPAADEVLAQDLLDVFLVDAGVPGSLGIHDDHRPFGTTVQATGGIDPDTSWTRNTELLAALLQVIAQTLSVTLGATLAAVAALVGTEEDVVSVIGHDGSTHLWGLAAKITIVGE